MNNCTYKNLARQAKERMKSGFWQSFDEDLRTRIDEASSEGLNATKVADYYVSRTIRSLSGVNKDDEAFYRKISDFLNKYGEASDAMGRLVDHKVYDKLDYEGKQRYMLELSARYNAALERYKKEKAYGLLKEG